MNSLPGTHSSTPFPARMGRGRIRLVLRCACPELARVRGWAVRRLSPSGAGVAFLLLGIAAVPVLGQSYEILKVNADAGAGFQWPYYLGIPSQVKTPTVLLVEPNNTGTVSDDPQFHDDAARRLITYSVYFAATVGSPMLVPAFPRPTVAAAGYTHALDRTALLTKVSKLERIDLQLLAMVADARIRLAGRGMQVEEKFWMRGFSASGSFVSRFVILHPDRVKAASIGAPGFGPTLPVGQWKGQRLDFHVGTADLGEIIGAPFDADSFSKLPLQVYVGDADDNIVQWFNPLTDKEVSLIDTLFGGPNCFYRWPGYEAAFRSANANAQFVIFPGLGHGWPASSYMSEFFERNRLGPRPALRKPVNFTAVVPYVSMGPDAVTELTLVNTGDVGITGQLAGYEAEGGESLASFRTQIPALNQRTLKLSALFPEPERVRYVTYTTDGGFLSGHATMLRGGQRIRIPLTARTATGELTAPAAAADLSLLLLNIAGTATAVSVFAYRQDGVEILATTLEMEPGLQLLGSPHAILGSGAAGAVRFRFSASQPIAACLLAGPPSAPTAAFLPVSSYAR